VTFDQWKEAVTEGMMAVFLLEVTEADDEAGLRQVYATGITPGNFIRELGEERGLLFLDDTWVSTPDTAAKAKAWLRAFPDTRRG
jgi:hypothetical protein